jgi:hypothetical protein
MKFEFETENGSEAVIDPTLEIILQRLEMLDGEVNAFCILEDTQSGCYIQCLGDERLQFIEYHEVDGDHHQHFLLGEIQVEEKKPWYKSWFQGSVGKDPQDHEWYDLETTKQVFAYFYQHGVVPERFQLRDITRFL